MKKTRNYQRRLINSSMIRDIKKTTRRVQTTSSPLAELASYETIASRSAGPTGMILLPCLICRDVSMGDAIEERLSCDHQKSDSQHCSGSVSV